MYTWGTGAAADASRGNPDNEEGKEGAKVGGGML